MGDTTKRTRPAGRSRSPVIRSSAPRMSPSAQRRRPVDRKSTRLNSSHDQISYAVFCLKKKKNTKYNRTVDPTDRHSTGPQSRLSEEGDKVSDASVLYSVLAL